MITKELVVAVRFAVLLDKTLMLILFEGRERLSSYLIKETYDLACDI